MFTYVCLGSNDLARAAFFYDATLAALGLRRCLTNGQPFVVASLPGKKAIHHFKNLWRC